MLHKLLYITSYHQSKFGKLKSMSVPEIVSNAVLEPRRASPGYTREIPGMSRKKGAMLWR